MTSLDFLAIFLLAGSSAVMAAYVCQLGNQATLTTFKNETVRVSLPCAYKLARITCGQVELRVYATNDLSPNPKSYFAPSELRVKIIEGGKTFFGRTTPELLGSAISGNKVSPWEVIRGDLVPDTQGLVGDTAVLKRGPVTVSMNSNAPLVRIQCDSDTFSSAPIDKGLCGDGVDEKEFETTSTSLFGKKADGKQMGPRHVLHYQILNNTKEKYQGDTCKGWLQTFKGCPHKTRALEKCVDLFDNVNAVGGLGKKKLLDMYTSCLKLNCRTANR